MQVEVISFGHLKGHDHECPRLHLYGTESEAPWYVAITEPKTVNVPVSKKCALVMQLFTLQRTDEGRYAYQRTGHALVEKPTDGRVELVTDDGQSVIGGVILRIRDVCMHDTGRLGGVQFDAWAHQYQPCHPEIEHVYVDKLLNFIPDIPGASFALIKARAPESEELFDRAARICMNRRGWKQVPPGKEALLLAEAIQSIVMLYTYTQDVEHKGSSRVATDRFSADMRVCGCGDCEDQAHEAMILWSALRSLESVESHIVALLREAARQYLCLEVLGCVKLPYSPMNAVYSTGTMYAHAFNMLVPCIKMKPLLCEELMLDNMCILKDGPVLTIDGTRGNQPDYISPEYLWKGQNVDNLKSIEPIPKNHYVFLSTAYTCDGVIYSKSRSMCPEIFFVNQSGERGVSYDEFHRGDLKCTINPTLPCKIWMKFRPIIEQKLKVLHPIPAYATNVPPPTLTLKRGFGPQIGEAFVNATEYADEGFMRKVYTSLAPGKYEEQLEYISAPFAFGVRIKLLK